MSSSPSSSSSSSSSSSPQKRRCGRCGADYEQTAFGDLDMVRTFAGEELAAHVVGWPDGVVVDVRACARCKTPIARLTRIAS